MAHWYIEGKCPRIRDGPQNISFALEASLLGQMFIFRTISNPRTLSFDIPAARRGLFTKYPSSREKQNGALTSLNSVKTKTGFTRKLNTKKTKEDTITLFDGKK